jgi:hypothetical protein
MAKRVSVASCKCAAWGRDRVMPDYKGYPRIGRIRWRFSLKSRRVVQGVRRGLIMPRAFRRCRGRVALGRLGQVIKPGADSSDGGGKTGQICRYASRCEL